MRFYFQDKAAGNFATKCIRVSSTATTQDVLETLAEKFRPDMRMLSSPKYSLYEVHVSGGQCAGGRGPWREARTFLGPSCTAAPSCSEGAVKRSSPRVSVRCSSRFLAGAVWGVAFSSRDEECSASLNSPGLEHTLMIHGAA